MKIYIEGQIKIENNTNSSYSCQLIKNIKFMWDARKYKNNKGVFMLFGLAGFPITSKQFLNKEQDQP